MSEDRYAPFRKDEVVEFSFRQKDGPDKISYRPTIAGRLRVAREQLIGLKIVTRLLRIKTDGGNHTFAVVQAIAEWFQGDVMLMSQGLGTSFAAKERRHLAHKFVEIAETRAKHRALADAGIGVGLCGAEEFEEDADETPRRRKDSDDHAYEERRRERRDRDRSPFEDEGPKRSSPPSNEDYRTRVGNRLFEWAKEDRDRAKQMLAYLVGVDNTAQMTEFQSEVAWAATEFMINRCDKKPTIAEEKLKEAKLPWFDKMSREDFKIFLSQYGDQERKPITDSSEGKKKDPF